MSDAKSGSDPGANRPVGAAVATDAQRSDPASSSPAPASDEAESTATLGSRPADRRPTAPPSAPTPAWPPLTAPAAGSATRGPGSPPPPRPDSNGAAAKPAPSPVGAPVVPRPSPRPVPGPMSTPTGPNSHASLHLTADTDKFQFSEAVNQARQAVAAAAGRGPRRARLQLKKVDPWSMMKFSFATAFVLFVMGVVASTILYTVLDAMGVFDSLNETITSLTTSDEQGAAEGSPFTIDAKFVIGGSALLGAVNMVLFTAMATLGAFIYNVCADLAGGIELTLAERE